MPSERSGLSRVLQQIMMPAIRVMNRLSYARKFALISFLFILPLALNLYFSARRSINAFSLRARNCSATCISGRFVHCRFRSRRS
jgi:hypothetical protein